jgi:hypothetical protein
VAWASPPAVAQTATPWARRWRPKGLHLLTSFNESALGRRSRGGNLVGVDAKEVFDLEGVQLLKGQRKRGPLSHFAT